MSAKSFAVASKVYSTLYADSYVNVGATEYDDSQTTMAGRDVYLNTGPHLSDFFGTNVPPLTTTIGGNVLNIVSPSTTINGETVDINVGQYFESIDSDKTSNVGGTFNMKADTALNITSPLTTINGDLTVNGNIINNIPPAPSAQFTYITAENDNGGSTVVSSEWTNLSMFNEISLQGLQVTHQPDGGIKFEQPGWYKIDGFTTHYAESSDAKFVTRLSNLSGAMSSEGLLRGTPVAGSGVSTIKGKIHVTDISLPWYFQYKSNTAHPNGLGLASGLDMNIYAGLDVTKI